MATSEPTALVAAWIAASLFAISLCSVGVSLLRTASATNVLPAPTSVAYALLLLIAISLLGLHGIVWTRYAGTVRFSLPVLAACGLSIAVVMGAAASIFLRKPMLNVGRGGLAPMLTGSVLFVAVATALFSNARLAPLIGAPALVIIWATCVLLMLTGLQISAYRHSIPVITLLCAYLVTVLYFNFYPNHQIRRLEGAEGGVPVATHELTSAFADWLACRPDLDSYPNGYPVFLLAAEGGGGFAAIHTNNVLSTLLADNPKFIDHLFAASVVSGGGMGASSFLASVLEERKAPISGECWRNQQAYNPKAIKARLDQFATSDLLSPLVAGALFFETIQALSPVRLPKLDRASWFEKGMEAAWERARMVTASASTAPTSTGLVGLARDYFSLWAPNANVPALLFNVSSAETGLPLTLSPFRIPRAEPRTDQLGAGQIQFGDFSAFLAGDGYSPNPRVRLSTAATLSSRFPYVFPPATVAADAAGHLVFEFVDGGYYDNTGIYTAAYYRDALLAAKSAIRDRVMAVRNIRVDIEVHLIVVGSFKFAEPTGKGSILSDLLSPIQAIAATRQARSFNAQSVLRARQIPHLRFVLNADGHSFPLALKLSPATIDEIQARLGRPELCARDSATLMEGLVRPGPLPAMTREQLIEHNACAAKTVALGLQ
jgi:hypothetical protein